MPITIETLKSLPVGSTIEGPEIPTFTVVSVEGGARTLQFTLSSAADYVNFAAAMDTGEVHVRDWEPATTDHPMEEVRVLLPSWPSNTDPNGLLEGDHAIPSPLPPTTPQPTSRAQPHSDPLTATEDDFFGAAYAAQAKPPVDNQWWIVNVWNGAADYWDVVILPAPRGKRPFGAPADKCRGPYSSKEEAQSNVGPSYGLNRGDGSTLAMHIPIPIPRSQFELEPQAGPAPTQTDCHALACFLEQPAKGHCTARLQLSGVVRVNVPLPVEMWGQDCTQCLQPIKDQAASFLAGVAYAKSLPR